MCGRCTSRKPVRFLSARPSNVHIGLLHGWLLEGSGSNIYVRNLAVALTRLGHDVHVICQEPHSESFPGLGSVHVPVIDKDLMPVYVADTEYPGFASVTAFDELPADRLEHYLTQWTSEVVRLVRAHDLEVLHANHVYPMSEVARRVKKETGVAVVVYPHGSAIEYTIKKSPQLKEAAGVAIDAADQLVIGNRSVTERLYGLYPERKQAWSQKHQVVSVGVDPELFEPLQPSERVLAIAKLKEALAAHQGEGLRVPSPDLAEHLARTDWENDRVIVYAGKLLAGKGVSALVEAFARVVTAQPTAWLYIVGEGPERERLEALAAEQGIAERVVFAGFLPHALYRHLLPCAHLAVFPSVVAEAYPLVLMEAMSAGVLPAASYFEGLADGLDVIAAQLPAEIAPLIRLPKDGKERIGHIARKLTDLLALPPSWSSTLRRIIVEEYSWDAVAGRMAQAYTAAITAKPSS
jgi:glycosyltransferase involved in cell wall biosynthesis